MPKGAKKGGTKSGRHRTVDAGKSDFTLYDFAHSSKVGSPVVTSGRLKKGEINAFHAQVKEVCGKSVMSEIWFEKDLSDFDLSDGGDSEIDDITKKRTVSECSMLRKGNRLLNENNSKIGVKYPLDIWFLLGNYISPEDVATFSAVCFDSLIVVHSVRFWVNLYKRFYISTFELPIFLQPSNLERVHGLKSRVVRSLFHLYPLFQTRLRCMAPFENDPDCLVGARCVRTWYQQIKQSWHFYLKFERAERKGCSICLSRRASRNGDSLRAEADVLHNAEEQSMILQVVSPNYVLLPEVVGQVLIKTFISVGHEMRAHKLKLIFNPTHIHASKMAVTNANAIHMDPVTNIHVLRWWDPKYPCRF